MSRDYMNDEYPTPRTLATNPRNTRMPDTIHWFIDTRKNTVHVRSHDTNPKTYRISVDVPGQRANTCTVPESFFREVADKIDAPNDEPEAAA